MTFVGTLAPIKSLVVQPETFARASRGRNRGLGTRRGSSRRVVTKRIADHSEQAVVRLAEIEGIARDEDPDARAKVQHDRSADARLLSQVTSAPLGSSISMSLRTRATTEEWTSLASDTISTKPPALCSRWSPCRSPQLQQASVPIGMPTSYDRARRLKTSRSHRASSGAISLRRFMPARCPGSWELPGVLHATVTVNSAETLIDTRSSYRCHPYGTCTQCWRLASRPQTRTG